MKMYEPVAITATRYEELPTTLVIAEVSLLCSVTSQCVLQWLQKKRLPGRKVGGLWLIERRSVFQFAKQNRIVLAYSKSEQKSEDTI